MTLSREVQASIAEDSDSMSVRELVEKHGVSTNTVHKYMRKKGPQIRVRAHFVDWDNGKWITLENVIATLEAERKTLLGRISKIDKAIQVLRKLT
jgi:predicted site-specific integrase-resolvase